jgi:DNA-binding transcriptional MerR regulator
MERTTTAIPEKLFYKAAEVCQITDTQPYVLRFWESEFPQLASEKNRSGQRVYRRADIDLVFRIKKLLYQEEYTIAGARKAIDEDRETIVEPVPARTRGKRVAPAILDPAPAPSPQHHASEPTSLFGETRPEAPEAPISAEAQGAADESLRYRALYEETLASLNSLKDELARSEERAAALHARSLRVASRLEAAFEG